MITIRNKEELECAFKNHEETIHVDDAYLSKILILAYRLESGLIHNSVIEHIVSDRPCRMAVGEGVMYDVDDILINQVISFSKNLENQNIELDVSDVSDTRINIFYGNS